MKLDEGEFHCPQCAVKKPFKHKKVVRFFTLYFIPLIPLGRIGEFVECQTCRGTFVPRVLEFDPEASSNQFQSQYEKAMRHSMILMMLADGEIDSGEMEAVHGIINKFGHNDMTYDELEKLVDVIQSENEPVDTYLAQIAGSLNEHGKEIIIKCALAVAASDGNIDPSEIKLIVEMGKAMDMSPSHVKGIMMEETESAPSFSDN